MQLRDKRQVKEEGPAESQKEQTVAIGNDHKPMCLMKRSQDQWLGGREISDRVIDYESIDGKIASRSHSCHTQVHRCAWH